MVIDRNIEKTEKAMLDAVSRFYDKRQIEFEMDILTEEGFQIHLSVTETEIGLTNEVQ